MYTTITIAPASQKKAQTTVYTRRLGRYVTMSPRRVESAVAAEGLETQHVSSPWYIFFSFLLDYTNVYNDRQL